MHEHHTEDDRPTGEACGSGKRNRFFRGKNMNAEAFALEQRYLIGRRRLVNRAALGWGVLNGFAVSRSDAKGDPEGTTRVGRGLGLDPCGREVSLTAAARLDARNTFWLENGHPVPVEGAPPGRYLLAIHYAERRIEDARSGGECGCGEPEKQFVCETAAFSLERLCGEPGHCPCAEEPCRPCACGRSACCGEAGPGHRCLCEWVAEPLDECGELCEWRGLWIVPSQGIPLACVYLRAPDKPEKDCPPRPCDPLRVDVEDACGPRRILKGNDLLYDLLRGCDLTRIEWTSWGDWHRSPKPMPWHTFAGMFHASGNAPVRTDFVVRFSGPVRIETLRSDVVVMKAVAVDQQTGWLIERRIPIDHLEPARDAGAGDGTTREFRVYVKSDWHWDEVEKSRRSSLTGEPFTFEIEVRGDYVLDCRWARVDANVRAETGKPTPSGNQKPGDSLISSFQVSPKEDDGAA